jgi:tartrate/fumarate subfamily iron-sulfur-dependent hydro-lyase beta chain
MEKELTYPFDEQRIRELRTGERVRLSGTVYTGRDRLHKFLAEGGVPPCDLRDGAIYHCGPVILRERGEWRVAAAGPTTSMREEPYMARIIAEHGVRVIIGKGGMGSATLDACRCCGCVYLQAAGGAAALLARGIRRVEGVSLLEEFGAAEAVWTLDVAEFDLVVAMDSHGSSLYDEVRAASGAKLEEVLSARGRGIRCPPSEID